MKKIFAFVLSTILVSGLFLSCVDGNSTYFNSWSEKKGFITMRNDKYEGQVFDEFFAESADAPEGETTYAAKRYSHEFDSTPRFRSLVIEQWNPTTIEYEEAWSTRNNFTISSTPEEVGGFWIYRDDDTKKVYIINTLYAQNFKDKKGSKSPNSESYRFRFVISGMTSLEFEMVETSKLKPWDY